MILVRTLIQFSTDFGKDFSGARVVDVVLSLKLSLVVAHTHTLTHTHTHTHSVLDCVPRPCARSKLPLEPTKDSSTRACGPPPLNHDDDDVVFIQGIQ